MARTPFVGGNWKMNTDAETADALAKALAAKKLGQGAAEVAVFPPFPYLERVAAAVEGSRIRLGAQDAHHQDNGAFTGEVSLAMLEDVGAGVVLTGHSERRHVIGETDAVVNQKTLAALEGGLDVILCIGETLAQREANQTDAVNAGQLALGLAGVSKDALKRVTIAYEPVWAIGTGHTASPEDAQAAHKATRKALAHLYDEQAAEATRIQYGGSVKPGNAADLMAQPDVDGFLVGGASLKSEDFAAIVEAAS
jgi:triosephosphate isomerase